MKDENGKKVLPCCAVKECRENATTEIAGQNVCQPHYDAVMVYRRPLIFKNRDNRKPRQRW